MVRLFLFSHPSPHPLPCAEATNRQLHVNNNTRIHYYNGCTANTHTRLRQLSSKLGMPLAAGAMMGNQQQKCLIDSGRDSVCGCSSIRLQYVANTSARAKNNYGDAGVGKPAFLVLSLFRAHRVMAPLAPHRLGWSHPPSQRPAPQPPPPQHQPQELDRSRGHSQ